MKSVKKLAKGAAINSVCLAAGVALVGTLFVLPIFLRRDV